MSLIALSTAKEFLQITHNKENTVLQMMIDSCEDWVQRKCGILFHAGSVPSRSDYCDGGYAYLRTPYHPMISVSRVYDRIDEAVVDSADYLFDEWKIWYKEYETGDVSVFWDKGNKRFYVTYKAGYTPSTVPAGIKMVILNLIHRQYNKRGGITSDSIIGASQNWEAILKSDELQLLRGYTYNLEVF